MNAPEYEPTPRRRIPNWLRPPDPIWKVRHEAVELRLRLGRMTADELINLLPAPQFIAEVDRLVTALAASPKLAAKRAAGWLILAVGRARRRVLLSAFDEALRVLNEPV